MDRQKSSPDNLLVMGRIICPFGVRGWLKIKTFTEAPETLADFQDWWLHTPAGWQKYELAEHELHSKGLVARLESVSDRTAAELLKGVDIAVPRNELPYVGEKKIYWADLVGLEVVNQQNVLLGKVESLQETGAHDVLVVKGEVERLIPYVETIIIDIDLAAKRMTVDWQKDY
ncbi:MAG: ribosome maturation factor RimM [Burkholderiales bacterium]